MTTKREVEKLWKQWQATVQPMTELPLSDPGWILLKVGFEAGVRELERTRQS